MSIKLTSAQGNNSIKMHRKKYLDIKTDFHFIFFLFLNLFSYVDLYQIYVFYLLPFFRAIFFQAICGYVLGTNIGIM